MKNNYNISVLPGDGIGPEVIKQVYKVFDAVKNKFKINITTTEHKVGGDAIDHEGIPISKKTIKYCEQSHAILFGSVGGPKWDKLKGHLTPEQGALLTLRKHFNLFANLRPIHLLRELQSLSPLKPIFFKNELNIIFVRELTGGIYFGFPKGRSGAGAQEYAFDTAIYHKFEIERIAHVAFKIAQHRKKHVTSIDKSNVLQTSILWKETISNLSANYPDITLDHLYVDNASMQLIKHPSKFDVILCPNLFGDILSDECAMISGSIGMLPSASLNEHGFGLYEPAGGSAPDIAGKNIANPIAQILSAALLFRYSLNLNYIAIAIEKAVYKTLISGYRTADIALQHETSVSTDQIGDTIASFILQQQE